MKTNQEPVALKKTTPPAAFTEQLQRASAKLAEASKLAEDPGLKRYLEMRAEALTTDVVMEHIEKVSYKNADHITVLSKGGRDYIINRGGNSSTS